MVKILTDSILLALIIAVIIASVLFWDWAIPALFRWIKKDKP